MTEPRIPEARDDDPEDVSDKLSIAAAMWGRGDRTDALTWLRRAAESASDADADMRALELAKAASELAQHVNAAAQEAAAPPAAPPAPAAAPAAPPAPPPKPSVAPRPATAAPPKPAPSAKPKPPGSRPPGGKLPPLPPLRPLGSAPPAAKAPPTPPARMPSMVTSVTGATSASGTIPRESPAEHSSKPMPWDEQHVDDEPTRQIAVAPAEELAPDSESTRTRELEPAEEPISAQPTPAAETTAAAVDLPLAIGVRVRLIVEGGRVIAEPDHGQAGVLALVMPASADDDLRTVFQR